MSEQLRYMYVTQDACAQSGVEQILAGGRDDELGSVRMTNGAAALPRLDCPSESHRREGADQNRKFLCQRPAGGAGGGGRWEVGGEQ